MQKQMDEESTSIKEGLDKFMNQIWPKIQLLENVEGRIKNLLEFSQGFDKRMVNLQEETQKLWDRTD